MIHTLVLVNNGIFEIEQKFNKIRNSLKVIGAVHGSLPYSLKQSVAALTLNARKRVRVSQLLVPYTRMPQ